MTYKGGAVGVGRARQSGRVRSDSCEGGGGGDSECRIVGTDHVPFHSLDLCDPFHWAWSCMW